MKSNKRLTVAHIIPWMGMGGVEMATLRMAISTQHLVRNVVFCIPEANPLRESFEEAGIETETYTPPDPSLRHVTRFYRESMVVADALKRLDVDIVHFSDFEAAYRCSYAALFAGCKMVCHVRLSMPKLSLRYRLAVLPLRKYIFVSKEAGNTFAFRVADKDATVIYDAVPLMAQVSSEDTHSVRAELGLRPGDPVVGIVSRVAPAKDFFTLASAAAEVQKRHPHVRFVVVGDNALSNASKTHFESVLEHIKNMGLDKVFLFTGYRNDVSTLVSIFDVGVLCSHREGLPLSLLEIMAMAKPVVATAVGGVPELITSGVNGYLHEHQDSKALASIINSLLDDSAMRLKIGENGLQHVESNYGEEKFVAHLMETYEKL